MASLYFVCTLWYAWLIWLAHFKRKITTGGLLCSSKGNIHHNCNHPVIGVIVCSMTNADFNSQNSLFQDCKLNGNDHLLGKTYLMIMILLALKIVATRHWRPWTLVWLVRAYCTDCYSPFKQRNEMYLLLDTRLKYFAAFNWLILFKSKNHKTDIWKHHILGNGHNIYKWDTDLYIVYGPSCTI